MLNKIKPTSTWLVAPALLLLAGCGSDSTTDFVASQEAADAVAVEKLPAQAIYSPSDGELPFPTNLLFAGSTDGTINIPLAAEDDIASNPQRALNQQNGFSTVAPIVTAISEALNPDTLVVGSTIRVLEVNTLTTPMQSVRELSPMEIVPRQIGNNLVLIPTVPLKPSTSYMVALTNGIKDIQGDSLAASFTYELAKGKTVLLDEAAEGLRQLVNSHVNLLDTELSITRAEVSLSWVFTTQSIREPLQAAKDISAASALELVTSDVTTTKDWNEALPGIANVYEGFMVLPYYLTAPADGVSPLTVLNGFWKNADGNPPGAIGSNGTPDFVPVSTVDVRVPVLMTLPNADSPGGGAMPADGYPVTVFTHGITRNRSDMLLMADAMAAVGRAVVAIDIPLHGLGDATDLLHAANNPLNVNERTFDLDLVSIDPTTGQQSPGPDSAPDPSGTHFINLADLANSRDNLRQAVADLFVLTDSLPNAQVDGVSDMLDTSNMTFVGHSLGGILGTTMLSYENRFQAATLAMPGGGIAQLLANSGSFGPIINGGLAANGIETGSADYQQFLSVAQLMLDSGDAINHASTLAANENIRLHLIEVIGDQVIPNSVATAPLSGTEPLIRMLGLKQADDIVADTSAVVKFTQGDHGSIINPAASLDATREMQSQMAGFAATQGATLPITDENVVQELPAEAAQ